MKHAVPLAIHTAVEVRCVSHFQAACPSLAAGCVRGDAARQSNCREFRNLVALSCVLGCVLGFAAFRLRAHRSRRSRLLTYPTTMYCVIERMF